MLQSLRAQRRPTEAAVVTVVRVTAMVMVMVTAVEDWAPARRRRRVSRCCSAQLSRSSSVAATDQDNQAARPALYLRSR
jgi:hypothetical protein